MIFCTWHDTYVIGLFAKIYGDLKCIDIQTGFTYNLNYGWQNPLCNGLCILIWKLPAFPVIGEFSRIRNHHYLTRNHQYLELQIRKQNKNTSIQHLVPKAIRLSFHAENTKITSKVSHNIRNTYWCPQKWMTFCICAFFLYKSFVFCVKFVFEILSLKVQSTISKCWFR